MPAKRPIVLLVEDSEDDALFFRRAVNKSGVPCTLVHAGDGEEAVRHLSAALAREDAEKFPLPDLVFLDLKLPRLSGFEVLEWLRDRGALNAFHVSVLSGSDADADVERANSLGAAAYYTKPLSVDAARSVLQGWMDRQDRPAVPR